VKRVMAQEGAAGIAAAVAESVQYQGRKASRQGSEQRRQDILDAAMRIVVRDGVRAVRHRAVAAEAGVPLSATTYYFKDIDDLLTDTFAQYVERSAAFMGKLWVRNEGLLREMVAYGDGSAESRSQLADDIARLTADYVLRQLLNRREYLMAEQAFRQEALLNPRLADLVRSHQQILLQGLPVFPGIGLPRTPARCQSVDGDYQSDGISGPAVRARGPDWRRNARDSQALHAPGTGLGLVVWEPGHPKQLWSDG
jgi:DNA-binding transcriptional regulator YbjK